MCSEDDAFIDIHGQDFKITTFLGIEAITPQSYVSCVYKSFWWVSFVEFVEKNNGDVCVNFMHPHGPCITFNWPQGGDKGFVLTSKELFLHHPNSIP